MASQAKALTMTGSGTPALPGDVLTGLSQRKPLQRLWGRRPATQKGKEIRELSGKMGN